MSEIESFDDTHTIVLDGTGPDAGSRVLKPGDLIGGSYKLQSLLGRGGMGYVFRAEHAIMKRDYALKILAPERLTEVHRRRFENEAKAIANLDHPNIVKVYNMGLDAGECPFYVMDLLNGTALSDYIAAKPDISFEECLDILSQIAAGLSYAHGKGIVHRDVKPSNMVLLAESSGRVCAKIVDFGIAKLLPSASLHSQSQTIPGAVFGSPLYMSPEQCMGIQVDHRSDIYSLGCTFFELLCGRPPYRGANATETVLMHQSKPIPSILETRPEKHLPPEVDLLLSKMMAKQPEDRYQSMEQLIHDLERVKQGKAIGKATLTPAARHNPYPEPDRSLSSTLAAESPEGSLNDRGHNSNPRAALFWILGAALLVGGAALCAWPSLHTPEQIADLRRPTAQDLGATGGPSNAHPQDLHTGSDTPGEPAAGIAQPKGDPLDHYTNSVPGFSGLSAQQPGGDNYRQDMPADELRKRLETPTPTHSFKLNQVQLSDQSFKQIGESSWIKNLTLDQCNFNNKSLTWLRKLRLRLIDLNNTPFNDDGAAELASWQGLEDILASSTSLSDSGVSKLATIRGLKLLSIAGAKLTDKGLLSISKAKGIIDLNLGSVNAVTDTSLSLFEHANLTKLVLDDTSISDAAFSHISKMTSLTGLDLRRTKVTFNGIKEFCISRSKLSKPQLKLRVRGCPNIGQKELRQLRDAFPTFQFEDKEDQ